MPNITVPKIEQMGLEPSDRATQSFVQAGRRISQNYNEAGAATDVFGKAVGGAVAYAGEAIVRFEEHREISQGAVAYAQILAGKTAEWNERAKKADPNDPTTGGRFMAESLNPDLEKFRDAFRTEAGRKWAEGRVDALRNHMTEKTTADMSKLAGDAAVVNVQQTVNALSVTVKDDPSALRTAMETFRGSVEALAASNPNFTATQASQFRQEATQKGLESLVKSAVFGAIQRNPDAGLALAQNPELAPYLNGMEVKQFESYARQQVSMARSEARAQKMWEREQKQERSDATSIELIKNMTGPTPTVTRETINKAYDDGMLTPQGYKMMGAYLEKLTKEDTPAKVSQQTWQTMVPRIYAAPDDPSRITSVDDIMRELPNLSKADFNDLVQKFHDSKSPLGMKLGRDMENFLNGYKATITKSTIGFADGDGDKKFFEFRKEVESVVERYQREGKDPRVLFDPSSPEFVGRPDRVMRYIAPMDRTMRSINDKLRNSGADGKPPLSAFEK